MHGVTQGARHVCHCGKGTFTSYRLAMRAAARVGAVRVYFCQEAGGWHMTRYSRAENDALWAERLRSNVATGRLSFREG